MNNFVLFGIVYSVAVSNVGRQINHTNNFTKCCRLELRKTKTKNAMFLTCEWKMKGYCSTGITYLHSYVL